MRGKTRGGVWGKARRASGCKWRVHRVQSVGCSIKSQYPGCRAHNRGHPWWSPLLSPAPSFSSFPLQMAGGNAGVTEVGAHNHPYVCMYVCIMVKFTSHKIHRFNRIGVTIQWHCYSRHVVQPSPLSGSRTFSSPQKVTRPRQAVSSHSFTPFLTSSVCLFRRLFGQGLVSECDYERWHKQRRVMDLAFSRR